MGGIRSIGISSVSAVLLGLRRLPMSIQLCFTRVAPFQIRQSRCYSLMSMM